MTVFFQQLVTSISIGGLYALLAVGYALIYSVFDFTNFAFGAVMMCGTFAGYFVRVKLNAPIILAIIVAIIAGIAVSVLTELVAYRPMRKKNANRLFLMISAMGMNIFITNLVLCTLGASLRKLPSGLESNMFKIGNVAVGIIDVISIITALVALAVLAYFLYKTRAGVAVRASAIDMSTAGLMGINVNRISLIVFVISGITAAIAGMFYGMKYAVYPSMGSAPANKAFIASVIGGLGSLPGAVIGGFFLGIMDTLVAAYISATYKDLFSFGIMIIVLMFLPNGLMGKGDQNKL